MGTVYNVLRPLGGVIRKDGWSPTGLRLSLDERVEIRVGLETGASLRAIAASLGRSPSTICREVRAGGGRRRYAPVAAHRRAQRESLRPKPTKLAVNHRLRAQVVADLERLWSPEQITARLRAGFPDDPEMRVSHETIYRSLFVQGRGDLRKELAACLRTGRAVRRTRGRTDGRGRIPGMVMISERPPEVEDRAVPGHWEGDLILGKNGASAIGTLVERSTRFVILLHLPEGRTAAAVRQAMAAAILELPVALRRSITWDQGVEMSQHATFSIQTGIDVYFCDPHSPWQRGSNENTNGLLRQYFPKGTDLSLHDPAALRAAADSLNSRPRQTLGWMTPSERLNQELVAMTG
ncbi:IS30 family transposase [Cellulomonas sp. S1-8]|nr:IS30 family transposase [Cellulomonas sp. S1-8]UZN05421.1 IS30 family transposase [Cellulomonas sp. S1-8]